MSTLRSISIALALGSLAAAAQAALPTEIRGTVQRPRYSHQSPGAHVHVQLLNARGQVIAERVQALAPTAPRKDASSNRRAAYTVRFTSVEAAAAVKHHAVVHSKKDCPSCTS